MRKISTIILILSVLLCSCEKNTGSIIKLKELVEVGEITNIEQSYKKMHYEILEINPIFEYEGSKESIKYEWNISGKVVSTERKLKYQCKKLGKESGFLKLTPTNGVAQIIEFEIETVTSFKKGLLILSQSEKGSVLSFKRLDKMKAPTSIGIFKEINPKNTLGAEALDLCWLGDGITEPNSLDLSGGLKIFISTANPTKVYALDNDNLQVKSEIVSNSADFYPKTIYAPFGGQHLRWYNELDNVVYFVGKGKESFVSTMSYEFLNPKQRHKLPDDADIDDLAQSLITGADMLRVYFNKTTHKFIYISAFSGLLYGKYDFSNYKIVNLLACDGRYGDENASNRYEPRNMIAIASNGSNTKIFRIKPSATIENNQNNKIFQDELILNEIDATNYLEKNSATVTNPIKPFLYYSDSKGNIYIFNYEANNFSTTPYISLGEKFIVKKMIFNPYDVNTLYIVAEDKTLEDSFKTSLFIFDIKDKNSAFQLFEEHKIAAEVKSFIYKN